MLDHWSCSLLPLFSFLCHLSPSSFFFHAAWFFQSVVFDSIHSFYTTRRRIHLSLRNQNIETGRFGFYLCSEKHHFLREQTALPLFHGTSVLLLLKHLKAMMVQKQTMISGTKPELLVIYSIKVTLRPPQIECPPSGSIWPLVQPCHTTGTRLLLTGSWVGQMCVFLSMHLRLSLSMFESSGIWASVASLHYLSCLLCLSELIVDI